MTRLSVLALIVYLIGVLVSQIVMPVASLAAQSAAGSSFGTSTTRAYKAAKAHPQVFNKLFCYCGCDKEKGAMHKSLSDCFKDDHGKKCAMCQAEALTADSMLSNHKAVSDIQNMIDFSYAGSYKGTPSPALIRYRKSLHH